MVLKTNLRLIQQRRLTCDLLRRQLDCMGVGLKHCPCDVTPEGHGAVISFRGLLLGNKGRIKTCNGLANNRILRSWVNLSKDMIRFNSVPFGHKRRDKGAADQRSDCDRVDGSDPTIHGQDTRDRCHCGHLDRNHWRTDHPEVYKNENAESNHKQPAKTPAPEVPLWFRCGRWVTQG